mmetsp:Transcript_3660/g.7581  ORF Transcript_3660/g.7581 Transcript_3660/m.7581 type:complete len:280 (-) Transcript_3660:1062-1901(-)
MSGQIIPKAAPDRTTPTIKMTRPVAIASSACDAAAASEAATRKAGRGTPVPPPQHRTSHDAAASDTAPVATRDPAWATLKSARAADAVDGGRPSASTIWPTLFVMMVPEPPRTENVKNMAQAEVCDSICRRLSCGRTQGGVECFVAAGAAGAPPSSSPSSSLASRPVSSSSIRWWIETLAATAAVDCGVDPSSGGFSEVWSASVVGRSTAIAESETPSSSPFLNRRETPSSQSSLWSLAVATAGGIHGRVMMGPNQRSTTRAATQMLRSGPSPPEPLSS